MRVIACVGTLIPPCLFSEFFSAEVADAGHPAWVRSIAEPFALFSLNFQSEFRRTFRWIGYNVKSPQLFECSISSSSDVTLVCCPETLRAMDLNALSRFLP